MSATEADLDRRLRALLAKGHHAVVAGVIGDGRQLHRGWGRAGSVPPDGSSLFEIGSITKAFTGVLLADMALRGDVALDDPLSRHLPSPRPAWRHREPTLLELATHRSGLPNTPRTMRLRETAYALGFGRRDPWAHVSEDDYSALLAREAPRHAPGGRARYSSMAVGLLGNALACRADTTYERLLAERVLMPLEMRDTVVTVPPGRTLLQGHSPHGRLRPPIEDRMPAAGSLRSTVEDMLRFLAACLESPEGSLGSALDLARRPHARIGRGLQVGLCWFILARRRTPPVVWHSGGTWGFRSFAAFAPDRGTAAVVLSNTARSVDRPGFQLVED